ncbi:esterase/lipase family protein [Nocardioides limicola]|uniref:esterase/lipase family protein n=1 Tax=Nocardioides limicola TaxID=2803368 RepID=UPI00193AF062|nr:alpha/beta fold hydrolase [Nocardioides sp. DJM-14]
MGKLITDQVELDKRSFSTDPFVVLTRPDRERPRGVVVMIHGLAGSGFATWRTLPAHLLQSQQANVDVAILDYRSAWRALSRKPKLEMVVDLLYGELQALDYESIVLVGHSMGGLLAASTVRHWSSVLNPQTGIERVAGMIYVASPRAGTKWLVPTRERRLLKRHSADQRLNERFLIDHVDPTVGRKGVGPRKIPSFTATASRDRFVGRWSTELGIPVGQTRVFDGSHSGVLANPTLHGWLDERISESLAIHRLPLGPDVLAAGPTTQFKGDSMNGSWEDAYLGALLRHRNTHGVVCRDVAESESDIGLRMRVVSDESVAGGECRADLVQDVADHDCRRIGALGIATYGQDPSSIKTVREIAGTADKRWLKATSTRGELEDEMARWLERLAINPILSTRTRAAERHDLGHEGSLL